MFRPSVVVLALLIALAPARATEAATAQDEPLPVLGKAPSFALVSQDREKVTLESLRGKVVALTFIYTWCPDVCPLLTDTMTRVQDELGPAFGPEVAFVSITFDPERDTPEALRAYGEAFDVDFAGWSFLTGDPAEVRELALGFGVVALPAPDGAAIDHNTLTTLIDRHGRMRVQYVGYRFDPRDMRDDLRKLVNEP